MSSDRAALAALLIEHHRTASDSCACGWNELGMSHTLHQAGAIIAAGWWNHLRVIKTDEDFESLPKGTIIHLFQSEQYPTLALIQPGRDENG